MFQLVENQFNITNKILLVVFQPCLQTILQFVNKVEKLCFFSPFNMYKVFKSQTSENFNIVANKTKNFLWKL